MSVRRGMWSQNIAKKKMKDSFWQCPSKLLSYPRKSTGTHELFDFSVDRDASDYQSLMILNIQICHQGPLLWSLIIHATFWQSALYAVFLDGENVQISLMWMSAPLVCCISHCKLVNWHFDLYSCELNLHPEKLSNLICWENQASKPPRLSARFTMVIPSWTATRWPAHLLSTVPGT